jgi:hypothetical protein
MTSPEFQIEFAPIPISHQRSMEMHRTEWIRVGLLASTNRLIHKMERNFEAENCGIGELTTNRESVHPFCASVKKRGLLCWVQAPA